MTDNITQHFGSLGELVEYCDREPALWKHQASQFKKRQKFTGTNTYDEARTLAVTGTWQHPKLPELIGRVSEPASRQNECRVQLMPDVVGVRPLVPLFLAGEPACMLAPYEMPTERRIVRVLINRCYSADVTLETAIEAGALVLGFLNRLETEHNITTELDVLFCGAVGGTRQARVCTTTTVKRAGQVLDISEVAFALAHPAYLRRLMFRYLETLPNEYETASYGTPIEPLDEEKAGYDVYLPAPQYYEQPPLTALRTVINKYLEKVKQA